MILQGAAAVIDESKLAEPVHEEADPGAGGPDDLRERLLADLWNHRLRLPWFSEVCEQD